MEWLVDEVGAGDEVGDWESEGGAKKTVKVAGPLWSVVRFTVIGTAGL